MLINEAKTQKFDSKAAVLDDVDDTLDVLPTK